MRKRINLLLLIFYLLLPICKVDIKLLLQLETHLEYTRIEIDTMDGVVYWVGEDC